MIGDLIRDSWEELLRSGGLPKYRDATKWRFSEAFASFFPAWCMAEPHAGGPVIAVNFQTQKKVRSSGPLLLRLRYALCSLLRAHSGERGAHEWYILSHIL